MSIGQELYALAERLYPIARSITGQGVRDTLAILKESLPDMEVRSVHSGTQCFDWTVPREWHIRSARITCPDGSIICDFSEQNLHVMGYSVPVDKVITLEELQKHLFSIPDMPDAIPYITSYYSENWGFCISDTDRQKLQEGNYHVCIDSELFDGVLNYGELYIPGETSEEIFISTYVCHPSMGNNEVSGPVVSTYLAMAVQAMKEHRYSYRFIFIPETIGSIVYISQHLDEMKTNIKAGAVLTCIGDDRCYSYLESRYADSYSDIVARHVMKHIDPNYKAYSFLHRGSDERQYCSPNVDLPIVSIMRSKYATYPEYHTSLDNMDMISPSGLHGGYTAAFRFIEAIENDCVPVTNVYCEPQLGKRGLYPTVSTKDSGMQLRDMMNLIAYADGKNSLIEIAEKIGIPVWELYGHLHRLTDEGLITLSY